MKTSIVLWARKLRVAAAFVAPFLCFGLAAGAVPAPQETTPDAKRARAIELYQKRQFLDALPLFEELAAANPSDSLFQEGLGVCLISHAATLEEDAKRQEEVKRARDYLERARALGDSSEIVRILLEITPADGNLPVFSGRGDVESAMREGEAAFARRDFDAAIAAYQRAMLLDPKLYNAPLFVGDSYFAKKDFENAGKWFAVAAAVDPDQETSYRYWGDALVAQNKLDEAHDKFIDAVIAEPYSQKTWIGLDHWAEAAGMRLSQPKIESPNRLSSEKGAVTITIDPNSMNKSDGSSAWLVYEIARASWKTKFAKEFPLEKEYRHSLAEESDALGTVAKVVRELPAKETKNLDALLKALVELSDRGLLEAYILLAKADEGITKDYPAYRSAHRGELRRYLKEYVGVEKR